MIDLDKIIRDAEIYRDQVGYNDANMKAHFSNCDPNTIIAMARVVEAALTLEKYHPAMKFYKKGESANSYTELRSCLQFSLQPFTKGAGDE